MSDTNNGWPDKPGVPMNPEEPRYHWVEGCDGEDTIVFWRGHGGDTHHENGDLKDLDHWSGYPMWIAQDWTYHGPCLTPDEATALQKRADQSALGYAREARRADLFKFLHKRDVAALQARVAELEAAVATIHAERNQLIGVLQLAVEQSSETGENEPAWLGPACRIMNAGFVKTAALKGGKKDER